MTDQQILSHVDHTLLKPTATWDDIQKLCHEAMEYQVASVCVAPSYVARINENYEGLAVCTVIGFPLGYNEGYVKYTEVMKAMEDGAEELDVVVNICDVKNGNFDKIEAETSALKRACGSKLLKLIVETCYLDEYEKKKMCEIVTNAGADYIKTSTGFGSAGATMEDILLFKQHIGPEVKIKASGGIRTREDMCAYLEAGCQRLGTSSAVQIIMGRKQQGSY